MRANNDYRVAASRQRANHIRQFLALDGLFAQALAVAACLREDLFQTRFSVGVFLSGPAQPAFDEFALDLNEANGVVLGEPDPRENSLNQTGE